MRLPVNRIVLPLAAALLAGVGGVAVAAQTTNGPAADYPVTIGSPYSIEGTTFTPVDTLNYDAVGHAVTGTEGGTSVSGAHHTLPVPSYVEVTSLETGRTILVRLDRRGPMAVTNLIELSPGAAEQLGMSGKAQSPVRVRRVNPPEIERAALRSGGPVPARMDTPMGLVGVLKRKLDLQEGKPGDAPQRAAAAPAVRPPQIATPAVQTKPAAAPKPQQAKASEPAQPARLPVAVSAGRYVVQVGAFAVQPNAAAAARKLGTQPVASGKLWRVRLGPFSDKRAADAALAKAKSAGYSDARIQRAS